MTVNNEPELERPRQLRRLARQRLPEPELLLKLINPEVNNARLCVDKVSVALDPSISGHLSRHKWPIVTP